jgi:hypothetical protein
VLPLALLGLFSLPSFAGPLDPTAFTSLGTLSLASGAYTLNTGDGSAADLPTITTLVGGVSTTIVTGVVSNGVAVFDFDSINITSGASIQATQGFGLIPVAFLSRSSATIDGLISVSAFSYLGGPGNVYAGLGGFGTIGYDPGNAANQGVSGGGGGAFGGAGGAGGAATFGDGFNVAGGAGGRSYASLGIQLEGGSQGVRGGVGGQSFAGGGGGGAIEIGTVGSLSIGGQVEAFGGNAFIAGAGGGSGGGIFLHGGSVNLTGALDVAGGLGGSGVSYATYNQYAGGGGGGGGQVFVESSSFTDAGKVITSGGLGGTGYGGGQAGSNGLAGQFVVSVPESGSLTILGLGSMGLAVLITLHRQDLMRGVEVTHLPG